jgi:hypothetical protein
MYHILQVFYDGTVLAGKKIYTELYLEQLAVLLSELHPMTCEFVIGLEIE